MHNADTLLRAFRQHFKCLGGGNAADHIINGARDVLKSRISFETENLRPPTSHWIYSPPIAVVYQMVHVSVSHG